MRLEHGLHLAYCTNIHRGESWAETFANLEQFTLAVRREVCPRDAYGIGLRLSDRASRELCDPAARRAFQRWLERNHSYVFTINGFPFGQFHGTRVKEQVYLPDWTSDARVAYTNRLFDLLAELVPEGVAGSVSTVPGSFKEFIRTGNDVEAMQRNLWRTVEHIARVSERRRRPLHLGLEPEPLCFLETSEETVRFFDQLRERQGNDPRLRQHLGVNYDTCHLAVEFEEPRDVLARFHAHDILISKLHFSSALKVDPNAATLAALRTFADDVYLHQVVARAADGRLRRHRDLAELLEAADRWPAGAGEEWRIHFHVPLHSPPAGLFQNTRDHLLGVMDALAKNPLLCSHIEMETYTWDVLPAGLKERSVVDQLAAEYQWTLGHLRARGLACSGGPSSARP